MASLYPDSWDSYLNIFTVFLRVLGLFVMVPGFSHKSIPMQFKVIFALGMSLAVYPIVAPYLPPVPETLGGLVLLSLRETIIGLLMGMIAYITFEAIHLGAQFIGYQIGMGTAGLIDPVNSSSVSPLVPLHGWIALILFFVLDMHHSLLLVFFTSFEVSNSFDAGTFGSTALLNLFISASANIFCNRCQNGSTIHSVDLDD
ncbi:unnamed protein product [marine sediment metagenome]|uniref:Flagellar biosynthetic protein FliR n=1 Tax=marine sediment metagenome TaxID=412755 RepID=X1B6A9_9ZZZZ